MDEDLVRLEFAYDAVGRRVTSTDHLNAGAACGSAPVVTRHVFAGVETLEEHVSCDGGTNFTLAREFVWGDRFPEPVAMVTHGGVAGGVGGASVPAGESVYHYLHDALGSVVALTNSSGRVVERYTYDPYGRTVIEQTNLVTGVPTGRLDASAYGNPFAWTGQRYDPGVKLYHFLFRSYSPRLGRWLQRDPIGYADGLSLYAYVACSPLIFVDPLGLSFGEWWKYTYYGIKLLVQGDAPPDADPDAWDDGRDEIAGEVDKNTDKAQAGLECVKQAGPVGAVAGGIVSGTLDAAQGDLEGVLWNGVDVFSAGFGGRAKTGGKIAAGVAEHADEGADLARAGRYSGRYADGQRAYRTNVPRNADNVPAPHPEATGAHSRLQPDAVDPSRTYSATEFDGSGNPVQRTDFAGRQGDKLPHQHPYNPDTKGFGPKE